MPDPAKEPILTCPYTGTALLPTFNPALNAWFCAGGFDPSRLFASAEELDASLRMRGGKPHAGKLKCPYTGSNIGIEKVPDAERFRVRGKFFTPRALFTHKQALFYAISTRGGVPPAFPEVLESTVTAVTVTERIEPQDPGADMRKASAETKDLVEEVVDRQFHQPKVAVSAIKPAVMSA